MGKGIIEILAAYDVPKDGRLKVLGPAGCKPRAWDESGKAIKLTRVKSLSYSLSGYWCEISEFMGAARVRLKLDLVPDDAENLSFLFFGCSWLANVARIDGTGCAKSLMSAFNGCESLKSLPMFEVGQCEDFGAFAFRCKNLECVPLLDTSRGMNFSAMFENCPSLESVPKLDTSKGIDFNSMFAYCPNLAGVPLLDTHNGVDFTAMFINCTKLASVPKLDTSNGKDFTRMFNGCEVLKYVPVQSVARGARVHAMFAGCPNLESVPEWAKGLNVA